MNLVLGHCLLCSFRIMISGEIAIKVNSSCEEMESRTEVIYNVCKQGRCALGRIIL